MRTLHSESMMGDCSSGRVETVSTPPCETTEKRARTSTCLFTAPSPSKNLRKPVTVQSTVICTLQYKVSAAALI